MCTPLPSHPRRLRGQEILMCAMCDNVVLFPFVTPFSLCQSHRGNSTCQINIWKIPGFLVQNSTNGELAFVSRYVFEWQCHAIRAVAICMLLLLHMAWNVRSLVRFLHASCECCRCRAFFRIAMADSLRLGWMLGLGKVCMSFTACCTLRTQHLYAFGRRLFCDVYNWKLELFELACEPPYRYRIICRHIRT